MKTFVVGDIHGAVPALYQVLERSNFDKQNDRLICLGDVCDGWPFVKQCFEELLTIKNLDYIMGNHDWWAYQFFSGKSGAEAIWLTQGGLETYQSYCGVMPIQHLDILTNAHCAIEDGNQIFVHGGIDPNLPFDRQLPSECMWDRRLILNARHKHNQNPEYKYGNYDDIFIGHTTTQALKRGDEPLHVCNIWNIDTGAGWDGKLTIMDVKTKKYWQSDNVLELMPDDKGRKLKF